MRLSSGSFETVSSALSDAFSASGDFKQLARCIDKSLQDITDPNGRTPDLVLALIECAETADAIEQLIACAKKQNPDNRRLAAIDVSALHEAAGTQQVVAAGGGASAFKQRLMEALGYLDTPGMQAVAGHELAALVETASDPEAETLHLALLGTVRASRPDDVVAELAPVVSDSLRRRIGDGKRPEGFKLDLARARLRRINLAGLDLHEADLAFADLRHADLTNTNLWRCRAYGVDVTKAGLSRSNLEEARWHAAVAREARFHDCRMVSAFFKDADLTCAEFQRSRLQGAHFERADLSGARFEQANLADASFRDAIIDHAAATSISRAVNWRQARFDSGALELISASAID